MENDVTQVSQVDVGNMVPVVLATSQKVAGHAVAYVMSQVWDVLMPTPPLRGTPLFNPSCEITMDHSTAPPCFVFHPLQMVFNLPSGTKFRSQTGCLPKSSENKASFLSFHL